MPRQHDDGRALFSRPARMRRPPPVRWGRPIARHHATGRDVDPETFKLGESGSGMNISNTDLARTGNFFPNVAGPRTFRDWVNPDPAWTFQMQIW